MVITILTFDNALHHYHNYTRCEVVKFLTDKGMTRVNKKPSNSLEFQIV